MHLSIRSTFYYFVHSYVVFTLLYCMCLCTIAYYFHTDPLAMLTLSVYDYGVDSFNISWSSLTQSDSVCQAISYHITLFVALDNGRFKILPTFTVNTTYQNFTGLNSSTSYSIEVMPIYNGREGNISSITVRTKDQPLSSTYVCMYNIYLRSYFFLYIIPYYLAKYIAVINQCYSLHSNSRVCAM